jgi:hypothetical protein
VLARVLKTLIKSVLFAMLTCAGLKPWNYFKKIQICPHVIGLQNRILTKYFTFFILWILPKNRSQVACLTSFDILHYCWCSEVNTNIVTGFIFKTNICRSSFTFSPVAKWENVVSEPTPNPLPPVSQKDCLRKILICREIGHEDTLN